MIVPAKLIENQAIATLMDELRRLKDMWTGPYNGIDSPTLKRKIKQVEEALELLTIYYGR